MLRFLQALRRRISPAPPRPIILMYHRVADPPVDPWGLAVQPRHFEEHLRVIHRTRRPLPMSEFVERLERHALPADAVALTFDDGYVDNLRAAKPRLAAAGVPATLFLTTGPIGQGSEYWWDELARVILSRPDALDCEIDIAGEPYRLVFPAVEGADAARTWRAWEDPRTERHAAYLRVWRRLRELPAAERSEVILRLRKLLSAAPPDPEDLPMTEIEVAELAADGVFEIGGHTVTHPVLPGLGAEERRREILEGRRACERIASQAIAGFAYPHGALDDDCKAAVRECGFGWACSTEARPVAERRDDSYALPRVGVLDFDGEGFERALRAADGAGNG